MIEIIEGNAADIAAIMAVMDKAFDPAFGEAWTSGQCLSALAIPCSRLLLATSDGVVAGFAMSRWVLESEEILMIGILPDHQRKSIGTLLLNKIVELARQEQRTQLFLEVRDGNAARIFYNEMGFQPIGRRKQYYTGSDGFRPDAITMAMDI